MFRGLPDKDSRVKLVESFFDDASLHGAIRSDDDDIVEALLEMHPESIDIFDSKRETLLMLASSKNKADLVEKLLTKFNANSNIQNLQGKNALMLAIRNKASFEVIALLAKSTDINAQDKGGRNALMLALERKASTEVIKLLAKSTDINAQDKLGMDALRWALENKAS
ncbi:hypothetical protein DB43_BY00020, partial [Parachlamydia acanthamoebae]